MSAEHGAVAVVGNIFEEFCCFIDRHASILIKIEVHASCLSQRVAEEARIVEANRRGFRDRGDEHR